MNLFGPVGNPKCYVFPRLHPQLNQSTGAAVNILFDLGECPPLAFEIKGLFGPKAFRRVVHQRAVFSYQCDIPLLISASPAAIWPISTNNLLARQVDFLHHVFIFSYASQEVRKEHRTAPETKAADLAIME